jgi:hypothetical protein
MRGVCVSDLANIYKGRRANMIEWSSGSACACSGEESADPTSSVSAKNGVLRKGVLLLVTEVLMSPTISYFVISLAYSDCVL